MLYNAATNIVDAMTGILAAVALTTAVAAIVGGGQRTPSRGDALAAYSLNGQNVEWPCASAKNACAADTGRHVAKNVIATRVQVWDDRAFVLTPRFRPGVPFTLSAVLLDCRDRCWPVLSAYPHWSLHDEGNTTAIRNAVDMYMDTTGVLWVLDTGLVNTMERPVRRARPRVIAIDVKTNTVSKGRGSGTAQNVYIVQSVVSHAGAYTSCLPNPCSRHFFFFFRF